MSKRLQVILPDDEYRSLTNAAKNHDQSVSSFVRSSLKFSCRLPASKKTAEERLALIMRFAKYQGPTADIEHLLEEIEEGRE